MVARLVGFLRPPNGFSELLKVCISYSNATLRLDDALLANMTAEDAKECRPEIRLPENLPLDRIPVSFESHKLVNLGAYNTHQQSRMELLHYLNEETPKV